MVEVAVRMAINGMSVIPVGHDKRALVPWEEYQRRIATEDEIRSWWDKHPRANIAMVTGAISGIDVIDWDDQSGRDLLDSYLPEILDTPLVSTPRGGGHIYFKHTDGFRSKNKLMDKVDFKADGGYVIIPPSKNGNGCYTWNISIDDATPVPMPKKLALYINKSLNNSFSLYTPPHKEMSQSQESHNVTTVTGLDFNEGSRDESLFHVANSLIKGGMSSENATQVLEILANTCNPPFPYSEVKAKVQSALSRTMRKQRNINGELHEFLSVTFGDFSVTSAYQAVTAVTSEEKAAIRQTLHRLTQGEKPMLERVGNKAGWYRKVERSYDVLDLLNASTEEYPIRLPLGLSEYCKLYPGNIIIVGGSKSSGKSCFMYNLMKLNRDKKFKYINMEAGETELALRLAAFDIPLEDWLKFMEPIVPHGNPWDVIDGSPDKIWVIDYLEPPEEKPYMIGSYIRNIFEKMDRKSLAFVGVQKPKGRDEGTGGRFTLEKARLVLSLDYDAGIKKNKIKIVDCKAWKSKSPRGLSKTYEIWGKGSRYELESGWDEE